MNDNIKIRPFSICFFQIISILVSIIQATYSELSQITLFILSTLFFILTIYKLRKEPIKYNKKKVYVTIGILVVIFLGELITYFTANNINVFKYMRLYVMYILFGVLVVFDNSLFYTKLNVNKREYNYSILFFVIINLIGCFLIYINNRLFIEVVQGRFSDIVRYDRYGFYQYSGVFPWPNHFAYVSIALFLMCFFIPVNKPIQYSLIILILLSGNRSCVLTSVLLVIYDVYFNDTNTSTKNINKSFLKYIGVIVLTLMCCILIIFYFNEIKFYINSVFNNLIANSSESYRNYMITQSFEVFKDHPIWGVGLRRVGELSIAFEASDNYILKYFPNVTSHTSDTFFTSIADLGSIRIIMLIVVLIKFMISKCDRNYKIVILAILSYSYSLYNPFSYITAFAYLIIYGLYIKEVKGKQLKI